MARVIGEAKEAFKEVVCFNCAARIKYTNNDVKRSNGRDYSGGPDGMEWVNCPKCGKKAIIKSW